VRAALGAAVEQLLCQDARLREAPDAEAVHQARVAVRRLRSDLRTFGALLDDEWAGGLRERLRWLADGLSAARDADVLIARLQRTLDTLSAADREHAADLLAPFRRDREAAYDRVGTMLREPRYAALLAELGAAARQPALSARADEPARALVAPLLGAAWKQLRRAVRRRSRPPADRELHRIRIKAKRVRYAAEALEPVGGRPVRRLARAVEKLQAVLGDQHDAVVAGDRLRREAATGEAAFLAGELAALEQAGAGAGRERWPAVWRKAKRRRARLADG
jgi:CHAD domain-containing protein